MATARCCCPCEQCRIEFDNFNRADSTNLGADWTEEDGDFEILDNEVITNNSAAQAVHTTTHDLPYVVSFRFKGDDKGDQIKLFVAVSGAEFLYAMATLETDADCATLSLHKEDGTELASTVVPGLVEDVWHSLRVCVTVTEGEESNTVNLRAKLFTDSGTVRLATKTGITGTYDGISSVGFGTGSITTTVHFDDFCWQRHQTLVPPDEYSEAEPNCPHCDVASCSYFQDDFDRSDSTNLGCGWDELSGDWEINNDSLLANATGAVEATVANPDGLSTMVLTGQVTLPNNGDTVRAAVAMSGTGYYLALEIAADEDCGTIKLISRESATDTTISPVVSVDGLSGGTTVSFWVCLGRSTADDANIYLMGGFVGGPAVRSTTVVDLTGFGTHAGLVVTAIGAAAIQFDSIELKYSYDPDTHEHCQACYGFIGCGWAYLHVDDGGFACDWEVITGTWTPDGLSIETSSSNAQAMTLTENPLQTNDMQAIGNFTATGNGTQAKVFLAGGDIVATFEVDEYCGTMGISGPSGSDDIKVRSMTPGVTHAFCVKYENGVATAAVRTGAGVEASTNLTVHRQISVTTTAAADGYTGGIGTGSVSGTVTFGGVTFSQVYPDEISCPWCSSCTSGSYDSTLGMKCLFEEKSGTLGGGETGNVVLAANGEYGLMNGGTLGATFVAVTFRGNVLGQKLRVHAGNDDSGTGPWGEIEFGQSPSTQGAALLSSGQSAPLNIFASDVVTVWLCLSNGNLTMTINPLPGFLPPAMATLFGTGTVAGTWGGVSSTGVNGNIDVSSVFVGRMTHAFTQEQCNDCIRICNPCSTGQLPAQFLVEIEGIGPTLFSPSPCCVNYNGAYIASANGTCTARWDEDEIAACTEPGFISVSFIDGVSTVTIRVGVFIQPNYPSAGMSIQYDIVVSKPLDCAAISGLVLPYTLHTGNTQCDATSSFVRVTAL